MGASNGTGGQAGFDATELRRCLGSFVTGVTVITTTGADKRPHGMTVNSFSSVSLDPPLILWSLRRNSTSFDTFNSAGRFIVNILAEDQIEISSRFGRTAGDRFKDVPVIEGLDGLPMIEGCAAYLECRTEATYPGGDHVVFLGRVERISNGGRRPLVFGSGKYMVVHPYDVGAVADGQDANVASLQACSLARPVVEELSRETDKTVGLAVWGNLGPTYIWWRESSQPLGVRLRSGLVVPVLQSASGLVFAAFSPAELVEPLIRLELAQAVPEGSAPSAFARAELESRLSQVRSDKLGQVIDMVWENNLDRRSISAFSAPVFNATDTVVLAMTMMGHADVFGSNDPALDHLRSAAAKLSHRLGQRPGAGA